MKSSGTLVLLLFLALSNYAQDNVSDSTKSIVFDASYVGDNFVNMRGGIKTGYSYLGLANINALFDTQKAGLWNGGAFYIKASNTHGATPSKDLVGDIQTGSNIEAGNHTYLQEFWYKQCIQNVEITVGLQDLNVEIANTDISPLFLNSSFGIHPIISLNLHAPIFPLTSLGITSKWKVNEKICWVNAAYDGTPTDFTDNPYNTHWRFVPGDGTLFVSELQHKTNFFKLPGKIKVGAFAHNHIIERSFIKDFPDSLNTNTSGGYVNFEQKIFDLNEQSVCAFLQTGISPTSISLNKLYLGAGICANGFLSRRKDDILGIAMAHAHLKENYGSETVLEVTWQKPLFEHIYIQPTFQYVIHPSGEINNLKNALIGIFRFGFSI